MKKTLLRKALNRSIKQSFGRFLSIFMIIALGASLFSGLRNTPASMEASVSKDVKAAHFADLTYIATLGFDQDDIEAIKKIKGIKKVEPGYQFDALLQDGAGKLGVSVHAIDHYDKNVLNAPTLVKGRYAKEDNEVMIDRLLVSKNIAINKTITLSNDDGTQDYKIVGIVDDIRYISNADRGVNTLGDGTNKGFILMTNKAANTLAMPSKLLDLRKKETLYNTLSIQLKALPANIFSEDYKEQVALKNSKIHTILTTRHEELYDDLSNDIVKKLNDANKDYEKATTSYQKQQADFKNGVNDAKIKLLQAKITLGSKEKEYYSQKAKINKNDQSSTKKLQELSKTMASLQQSLQNQMQDPAAMQNGTALASIAKQIAMLTQSIGATTMILSSNQALEEAKLKLDQAANDLSVQEANLALKEVEGSKQLDEASIKLKDAKKQLDVAKGKVDEVPKGTIYTLSGEDNIGLVNYQNNITAIKAIAYVFPLIFFLVAALVSLTAMYRMVESEREYNGTLRALGYSNYDVMKQYLRYALLATLPASLIGILLGNQFFVRIILYLYHYIMFNINNYVVVQGVVVSLLTILLSVGVTSAVTLIVCRRELFEMPASLMRPKAPKMGKRILLERLPFIWRRLSFNQKVTLRNILRYKARFFMSIIGIAGCTGLIITGFGIKDSVKGIVDLQYGDVYQYDAMIHFNEKRNLKESNKLIKSLEKEGVSKMTMLSSSYVHMLANRKDLDTTLNVYASSDDLYNFINFQSLSHKKLTLDDEGVIITQKASELTGLQKGDRLYLKIGDEQYEVKVSGVMKNYYGHLCFMSKTLYEKLTHKSFMTNTGYVNFVNNNKTNRHLLSERLTKDQLGSIEYLKESGQSFANRLSSLDIVIAILIIFAGLLDFIVLYNLTTINIEERKREIATIKVLGFRKREYYDYIFRENSLLSFVGAILGFLIGMAIHGFIIHQVEFEATVFIRSIHLVVFLIAFMITMLFTYFINLSMRHVLRRVDMVESLKSIE